MLLFACFVAIILLLGLILGGGLHVYWKSQEEIRNFNRKIENIQLQFVDFFTPGPDDGEPSEFQKTVEAVSEHLAGRIGVTIQAGIRGQLGGAMNGIVPALQAEAAENLQDNPELVAAAFQDALPKSLKKNTLASIILQNIVGKFVTNLATGGPGAVAPGKNGRQPGRQVKFKL